MELVKHHHTKGAGFIAGVIFIVVGLVMNPMLKNIKEEAASSENWPTAPGVVTVSEVLSFESTGSDGKKSTMYRENISALYSVDGREYHSDGLNIMSGQSSTSSRGSVKKKTRAYPEGSEVKVYYDPEDPSYGILEPGLPPLLRLLFFLPWLAVITGILVILGSVARLAKIFIALGIMAGKKGEDRVSEAPAPPAGTAMTAEETVTVPSEDKGDDGFSL